MELVSLLHQPLALKHPFLATVSVVCDLVQNHAVAFHCGPQLAWILHLIEVFLLQSPY